MRGALPFFILTLYAVFPCFSENPQGDTEIGSETYNRLKTEISDFSLEILDFNILDQKTPPALSGGAMLSSQEMLLLSLSSEDYPTPPGDMYQLTYTAAGSAVKTLTVLASDYTANLGVLGNIDAEGVTFLDLRRQDDVAERMAAANALLVPLGDHAVYPKFIPSKLFDSMASGRPVLVAVDGEACSILEAADAGVYYPAENAAGLVNAITKLKDNPEAAAETGRNGRSFAVACCSREEQARIMIQFIGQIVLTEKERADART